MVKFTPTRVHTPCLIYAFISVVVLTSVTLIDKVTPTHVYNLAHTQGASMLLSTLKAVPCEIDSGVEVLVVSEPPVSVPVSDVSDEVHSDAHNIKPYTGLNNTPELGPATLQYTQTVPPMHLEEEVEDENARIVVLETCKQLLLKLEAVRLSVLHLQYSIHAGALGSAAIESDNRAKQLWSWDKAGVFATEAVSQFTEGVFKHESVEDAFRLPGSVFAPETLEELQVPTSGFQYDV
jgi:hypothetical protein